MKPRQPASASSAAASARTAPAVRGKPSDSNGRPEAEGHESALPPDAPWARTHRRERTTAEDGTGLHYEVVGEGERALVLANGLGGRLYAWAPLIDGLWRTHRIITWDYRGLFDSDVPANNRRLSVPHHCEDALAIMRVESVERAAFAGWSMGVQVSLDFAATYPERVAGLVLLNGTYGQIFTTGFQPLFSVPWLPRRLHKLIDWLRDHEGITEHLARAGRAIEVPSVALAMLTAGPKAWRLRPMLRQYFHDVMGPSFSNFLRLFQELDAHSVYHVLRDIETPALIVSGALDVLTPAYQSAEMARRMPNAEILSLWRASHFALVERSEVVVPAIERFLRERARW